MGRLHCTALALEATQTVCGYFWRAMRMQTQPLRCGVASVVSYASTLPCVVPLLNSASLAYSVLLGKQPFQTITHSLYFGPAMHCMLGQSHHAPNGLASPMIVHAHTTHSFHLFHSHTFFHFHSFTHAHTGIRRSES